MALTYEQAGVSISLGNALVEKIKPLARSTRTPFVLDDVGGFAGLCSLPATIEDPVLVSGTDGVGTKLEVAFRMQRHDTVGIDLVAMCVNDIVTTGAEPLFFLDYFVCGKLDTNVAQSVISGIAEGCKLAGCALLGGETAEHPGKHPPGEYDLAGFAVGVASRQRLLGPARVKVGDRLVGVASSGLHSNGFSLARQVVEKSGFDYHTRIEALGGTLGQALLTPTRIYANAMRRLCGELGAAVHAACHVTGGGIVENLPRVLGAGKLARVRRSVPPPIFGFIAEHGPVEQQEMDRTFNMGVGLIAIVEAERQAEAIDVLRQTGETAFDLGAVEAGNEESAVHFI